MAIMGQINQYLVYVKSCQAKNKKKTKKILKEQQALMMMSIISEFEIFVSRLLILS